MDSLLVSLLRGRVGASILAIIAAILSYYGFSLSEDQQAQALNAIITLISIGSAGYSVLSKSREIKTNNKKNSEEG